MVATPGAQQPAARKDLTGTRIPRREDHRLITGTGGYIDDLDSADALHLRFVRSAVPHGVITSIDVPDDLEATVFTAANLGAEPPEMRARYRPGGVAMPPWPLLAYERVRYVGEPIAAVLAETPYLAEDAAEMVFPDCSPLPAVVDPLDPGDAPPLHAGFDDNVLFETVVEVGDAIPPADGVVTVRRRFRTRRHTGMPLENRGCLAIPRDDGVTLWSSTQLPHLLRSMVADVLGWDEDRVQVRVPDIGGGFGVKGHAYPDEALVALLAVTTGRPVKWIEDRSENLMASIHARDHRNELELDVWPDGRIAALRADLVVDCGAYPVWPQTASLEAQMASTILPGPYQIANYRCRARAVATNKSPHGTYRGVARPSSVFAVERLVDEAARELGMSPVELRLRNVVTEFPYDTGTGLVYDSGSYRETIEVAADKVGYTEHRQQRRAADGPLRRGIGFACFVEQSAHVPPWARRGSGVVVAPDRVEVTATEDGTVHVEAGINSHGQGQETTLAQVVADRLALPFDRIKVRYGDTGQSPYSMGTLASRSAVVAGTAAAAAADALKKKMYEAAANHLAVAVDDVAVDGDELRAPDGSAVSWAELVTLRANAADRRGRPIITAEAHYQGPDVGTFSNACHAAVIDVDVETAQIHVRRYLVVEDCGQIINPLIVEGQIHGGVAQGIGSALYEELVYDETGQLVTTTLMDYRLPSSLEVPAVEIEHLCSPGSGPLGVKGMGESGAIGPMAAIANAVADAVGPERAGRVVEVPLVPDRMWRILRGDDDG